MLFVDAVFFGKHFKIHNFKQKVFSISTVKKKDIRYYFLLHKVSYNT